MDVICFSHLRWNFVYQRPQHLLSRFARIYRVFYIEEPVYTDADDGYTIEQSSEKVWVVVPHLKKDTDTDAVCRQKNILNSLFNERYINRYLFWYYTPMALQFSNHFSPLLTVYDCMDELSVFKFAPPQLKELEKELISKADLMFTGGHSLYEAKKHLHASVHAFPSSIDKTHFARARGKVEEPADQAAIPHPRLGFYGVIDERFDIDLIGAAAAAKPDWHFILIGPVVKIDPASLPQYSNIHYLGGRSYAELPAYLSGWDIATIPFALNESTRFISPTKTPEYLAAGKPVIATAIRDVVNPYGVEGLVHIANAPEEFVQQAEAELALCDKTAWLAQADAFLANNSWDNTWQQMVQLIDGRLAAKQAYHINKKKIKNEPMFDYIIAGAGFAGSVLAERLATKANKKVLLIDKRNHIGGNTYDYYNNDGILIHKYGPHIFHTNSKEVFEYLGQFTQWRPYEHRVLASVDGQLVPIPINQNTINSLFGLNLSSDEVEAFFKSKAEHIDRIQTSEDVVVSKVGRELYEKFFKNYTRKQWALDPSQLDASVTARVPTRTNKDDRYFTDTFQAMPLHGYTQMFQKMLAHPNIKIMLNTDYKEVVDMIPHKSLIFTGPIDSFFDYCYGKLPYRSLEFQFETIEAEKFQSTGTVNYPNEHLYTRITEFKYLTGQKHAKTSIVYEYPKDEGDPYYPIPTPDNAKIYKKYQLLAAATPNTYFAGRLGTYKYYNMDQVVAQSLTLYKKLMQAEEQQVTPASVNGVNGHKISMTQS